MGILVGGYLLMGLSTSTVFRLESYKGFDTPFRSLRRFRSLSLSRRAMGSAAATAAGGAAGPMMDPLDERAPSPAPSSLRKGMESTVDRGTIVVSWYEGTTSSEMTNHVFNCVLRKLNADRERERGRNKGGGKIRLEDVRLLDESVTPHGGTSCFYFPT